MYSHFIDVSNYQKTSDINWQEVAKSQAFVVLKATEGVKFIDKSLNSKVLKCREHNIPFGLYHFARPDNSNGGYKLDAKAEAIDFCKQLNKYNDFTIRPVLDLEYEETPLNRDQLTEWCEIFASVVKKETGRDIILYGNYYYLRDNLAKKHELGRFPLWIAQYNHKSEPNRIPDNWEDWAMWQYTDKHRDGTLYPGNLDGNWAKSHTLICV